MLSKPEFAKQVCQALENLHDFAYLQNLTLTRALTLSGQTLDQSVRWVRAELLRAIDDLNPAQGMPSRAKERRPYALLYGRYVQGMSTAELMEELAISVRQLRREHRRAVNAVVDLLWGRFSASAGSPPATERQGGAELETEQLIRHARTEDLALSAVMGGILPVLSPVTARRGLSLRVEFPEDLPTVRADRIVLRQAMLELVSYASGRLAAGDITVGGTAAGGVRLSIRAAGRLQVQLTTGEVQLEVSQRLIAGLGGQVAITERPGEWQAIIDMPATRDVPILVMDDNQGLVELFRRYLAGRRYHVIRALTAEEAIREADSSSPELIVLDVMMPGQDGWEVLQRLRATPETAHVPIVVCSVLNEPEIALSLGASGYLVKPVTQDALLHIVERWCNTTP